jgi:histidinol dehydrogenase
VAHSKTWNRNEKYIKFWSRNQFVTLQNNYYTIWRQSICQQVFRIIVADDLRFLLSASDLLSQAEHGADSQVILVSTSKKLIDAVEDEINSIELLPKEIAEKSYC